MEGEKDINQEKSSEYISRLNKEEQEEVRRILPLRAAAIENVKAAIENLRKCADKKKEGYPGVCHAATYEGLDTALEWLEEEQAAQTKDLYGKN